MLVGNKTDFAVEYTIEYDYSIKNMGHGKIWIKNEFIGTDKDLIYLNGYLLGILNDFKRAKELKENLKHLSKEELFNLLISGDYEYKDMYRVVGSTFTDDFLIWKYKIDNLIYILWKVWNTEYFEDLKNYKQDVFLKSVSTDTLNNVIAKLEDEYRELGILKKSESNE